MLYRTRHQPFIFSLNPFTPFPLSSSSPLLFSSASLQVVEQGMEPVEMSLKESFKPDTAAFKATPHHPHHLPPHQQALFEDLSAVNCQTGEDSFVDGLLDFSNAVTEDPEQQKQQETFDKHEVGNVKTTVSNVSSTAPLATNQDFGSLPAGELSVPGEDLESLEWLSRFVEDSFSEYSLTCPATKPPPEPNKAQTEPEATTTVQIKPFLTSPVQTKARTKRARTGLRVWPLGYPSLTETSASSTSSSSSTTSSCSPCQPWLAYSYSSQTQMAESLLGKPPVKKPKKKPAIESAACGGGGAGGQQPRRCSHCGVQKTPQWRAGPLGAKTLCNACGVRFKSGRLLPEYRPACSPTFSSELHSNNHRKVLEMRQKKELESGLAPPVRSF